MLLGKIIRILDGSLLYYYERDYGTRWLTSNSIRLPRGFGTPVTLKDTLTSSPIATAIDFSEGLETNIAGFPPSIAPGDIISIVAAVSTYP